MSKRVLITFILIALSSICFAQGFSTPCDLIYPDALYKDSFILLQKNVNIQKCGERSFESEVVLDVENVKGAAESTFIYLNPYDPTSRSLKEDCISVYINNKFVRAVKDNSEDGDMFLFTAFVPEGRFKIKYVMEHGGSEISGTYYCEIENNYIGKWNVSASYSETISASIYNDVISFDPADVKLVGTGKQSGNSYFLKSGYISYSTKKKYSGFSIHCQNFYNGFGGGSGCPIPPSIYSDDEKIHSAIGYIYEFITDARIVEEKLKWDNDNDYLNYSFSKLLEVLEKLDKDELRLLRNAFYAKNNYVFKNSSLNNFFSSAICYFPDKSVTVDKIKIEKHEKILIEMIQAAEKGESSESVINKYKE
ncbi:YARHG domain-containing protein [Treponema bryantii]|uniref:YARHG domain-containing protein n=1 Tax=Treponema bryantii TaxID=163 RepID=UPI002B27F515|nr:hypothetical protein TRBR_27510 [Treponema bryantii]